MKEHTIYVWEMSGMNEGEKTAFIREELRRACFDLNKKYNYMYNPRDNSYEYRQ